VGRLPPPASPPHGKKLLAFGSWLIAKSQQLKAKSHATNSRGASFRFLFLLLTSFLILLLSSCELPANRSDISVSIIADGKTRQVSVASGSTVTQALQAAGLTPGQLDKSDPPFYAVLSNGDSVKLVRVVEKFDTETQTIPFERQIVRNESLPVGQQTLVQAGVSGQQEITFRTVLEDGVETSRSIVKTVILQDTTPEIVMVGAQASFAPLPIPGKIAYLAGRVFSLSPDGGYLLFTRKSKKPPEQQINTLWAVSTKSTTPNPVWLKAANVVHWAAWYPDGSNRVAYSTVEPRSTAPGWQANNDLWKVGLAGDPAKILDASSGGVYGWWGVSFAFSPDGRLAYARPDGIGLVSQDGGYLAPLISITPLQTHSDWAWDPGIAWGSDGKTLYFVDHAPAPAPMTEEESPYFDLKAASMTNDSTVDLTPQVGMFAYPSSSPVQQNGQEKAYEVAYLQAIFPDQSESSRYRLVVMDRDGSNRRVLFPSADAPGLDPQTPVWAPGSIQGQVGNFLAVVYQGNLWLIDSGSGQAYQITGDGLTTRIDWQ
jgi:hypothetical protein